MEGVEEVVPMNVRLSNAIVLNSFRISREAEKIFIAVVKDLMEAVNLNKSCLLNMFSIIQEKSRVIQGL